MLTLPNRYVRLHQLSRKGRDPKGDNLTLTGIISIQAMQIMKPICFIAASIGGSKQRAYH